jgi:hypothetical protein
MPNEFVIKNGFIAQGQSTITGSLLTTQTISASVGQFNSLTASSVIVNGNNVITTTGSLLMTASILNSTITFTKGDGSTFPIIINNVTNAVSASYSSDTAALSASIAELNAKQFPSASDGVPYYNLSSTPSVLSPPSDPRSSYVLGWYNNQLAWVAMSLAAYFSSAGNAEIAFDGTLSSLTETIYIESGTIV